jgi:hypothetical protein
MQGSKNVANITTPVGLHGVLNVLQENMNMKENTQVQLVALKVVTPHGTEKKEVCDQRILACLSIWFVSMWIRY